jgi:predicted dehydrogenase
MMEKPLAVSRQDGLAIKQSAQQGRIHVMVNYETTWYRSNRAAYDLVQEKAIGDIRKVVVHDGHRGPKEIGVGPEFLAWLTDPKLNGGGALFDFGCYGADLMTWLMEGRPPDTVTAVTQRIKPEIYPLVDDEATIILTYPKAQAIIQASWNWPFDRKDMEVYGETGYAITVRRDDIRVRREGQQVEEKVAAKPLPAPYDDHMSYLKAVVLGEIQPDGLSSLETNLIVTEILDAARESANTGELYRYRRPGRQWLEEAWEDWTK